MKINKKQIENFIIFNQKQVTNILNEISGISGIQIADDGPAKSLSLKSFKEQIQHFANLCGMKVLKMSFPDVYLPKANSRYSNEEGANAWLADSTTAKQTPEEGNQTWFRLTKRMANSLGMEMINTLEQNINENEDKYINGFLNEVFNITDNNKFYITYVDERLKICRNKNEFDNPLNIISIITENTSDIFISKLIGINDKINKLQNLDELFDNGNNFLCFSLNENNLKLTNIINKDNKTIGKDVIVKFKYAINKIN